MITPTGGALIPMGTTTTLFPEKFLLRRSLMRIGRSPRAEIYINDPHISRLHAELEWQGMDLILRHRSQTNVTLVNGVQVADERVLQSGDIVEISSRIMFRLELFGAADGAATIPSDQTMRQIHGIIHADCAGYTIHSARDEIGTAERLQSYISRFRAVGQERGGSVVTNAGDGVLSLFNSIFSALDFAIGIQREFRQLNSAWPEGERLQFRIGMNLGDVLRAGNPGEAQFFGNSINLAQRVQELAEPGGILVTGAVFDQVQSADRTDYGLSFVEERKIIDRILRLYSVDI